MFWETPWHTFITESDAHSSQFKMTFSHTHTMGNGDDCLREPKLKK